MDHNQPDPSGSPIGGGRRRTPSRQRRSVLIVLAIVLVAGIVAALVGQHLNGKPTVTPQAHPSPKTSATPTAPQLAATPTPVPTALLPPSKPRLVLAKKLISAGPAPSLPWPTSGQAEVQIVGLGGLGHSGSTGRSVPIASIAKVMTAYTILRDHPLRAGQSGPTITVSAAEAAAYPSQQAQGLSVVKVASGERLTERQALKGLLIASGDNMAEILARWDAGSVSAFVQRMNRNAGRLGMSRTHYADPTGLSSATVSTVGDLVNFAPRALSQSTIAELTSTASDSIPLNPQIHNPNSLLGVHGVFGIKTGTTTAAGGCLMFAAHRSVEGKKMTIYGAVLGISGDRSAIHSNARDAADALVVGAGDSLHRIILIRAGQPVATYVNQKGRTVQLTIAKTLAVTGWSGQKFSFSLPSALRKGHAPANIRVHLPNGSKTVKLVAM